LRVDKIIAVEKGVVFLDHGIFIPDDGQE